MLSDLGLGTNVVNLNGNTERLFVEKQQQHNKQTKNNNNKQTNKKQ